MKKFRGIRYGFRPKSYWDDSDPLTAILKNIKGENRRQMLIDYWNAGHLEKLNATLLQDELDAEERCSLGRIHPSFMGGEYLPSYLLGEVEIARIWQPLLNTTREVLAKNQATSWSSSMQWEIPSRWSPSANPRSNPLGMTNSSASAPKNWPSPKQISSCSLRSQFSGSAMFSPIRVERSSASTNASLSSEAPAWISTIRGSHLWNR